MPQLGLQPQQVGDGKVLGAQVGTAQPRRLLAGYCHLAFGPDLSTLPLACRAAWQCPPPFYPAVPASQLQATLGMAGVGGEGGGRPHCPTPRIRCH